MSQLAGKPAEERNEASELLELFLQVPGQAEVAVEIVTDAPNLWTKECCTRRLRQTLPDEPK